MNRQEKIEALIEVLDENNIKIIETSTIQGLIIDAQFTINEDEDEYNGFVEKGLTDEDFKFLEEFFESTMWMMIKIDDVQGVSFDNVELSLDMLYESDLWKDEEDSDEEEEE